MNPERTIQFCLKGVAACRLIQSFSKSATRRSCGGSSAILREKTRHCGCDRRTLLHRRVGGCGGCSPGAIHDEIVEPVQPRRQVQVRLESTRSKGRVHLHEVHPHLHPHNFRAADWRTRCVDEHRRSERRVIHRAAYLQQGSAGNRALTSSSLLWLILLFRLFGDGNNETRDMAWQATASRSILYTLVDAVASSYEGQCKH